MTDTTCCMAAGIAAEAETGRRIVLAGNPNVGKSVFFHALTGIYVDVSNYPGTTVTLTRGRYQADTVIDTPGIYGVSSLNDEERVARSIIVKSDIVVNVVDATRLERDLFLTLQLIDMGLPLIVVLNMADEVVKHGMRIDRARLARRLGVEVVETVATKGIGLSDLKEGLAKARVGRQNPEFKEKIDALKTQVPALSSQAEALLALEGDEETLAQHSLQDTGAKEALYVARRARVDALISACVTRIEKPSPLAQRLGDLMISPWTGLPILAVVLFLFYQIIGVFIAQTVVGFTEKTLMQGYYEPAMRAAVGWVLPLHSPVAQILVGEFGVITMTVTYLVGLLLPLVLGFYAFIAILEDSGYLPRLATLSDAAMVKVGLNGRAVIPFILGFGCVTMALMTTRILGSKRERLIATALLCLAVPCSAQLAVITVLLSSIGAKYALSFLGIILGLFVVAGWILSKVLPGRSTDLFIDLPALRLPRIGNVAKKTWSKTVGFMKDAAPLFLGGAALVGTLNVLGILERMQNAFAPFVVGWLRLPKETATAFLMGFVRRDFGTAGLLNAQLTPWQVVVALVTMTLFVPCIATTMVLFKERSFKEAIAVWVGAFSTAFLMGGLIAHVVL